MAIGNPRHAPDKASASAVRENPHAREHRIRQIVLRDDFLEGILQRSALRAFETRNGTAER